MTIIKTSRLEIKEITSEQVDKIEEISPSETCADTFLTDLSLSQRDALFENSTELFKAFKKMCTPKIDSYDIYGAFFNSKLIGYIIFEIYGTSAEIRIALIDEYKNKGYGFEFLSALLNYYFNLDENFNFRYLSLSNNNPSIALATKIGGILQKAESDTEELMFKIYVITKQSFNNANKK